MVYSLRERVVRRLGTALAAVARHAKEDSCGIDQITLGQFIADWRSQRVKISHEILNGEYRFAPLRGVAIPKDKRIPRSLSNVRPISILAIRDRVVQRAMYEVMWPHLRDHVHSDCSFGGIREYKLQSGKVRRDHQSRPKSVRAALERIVQLRTSGLNFVFETDILNFFSNVNRERLLSQLNSLLPDTTLGDMLPQTVSTQLGNLERLGEFAQLWNEEIGIPQGGVLSPLFANLYLYPFDDAMRRAGFALVRYMDDLVVLTRSREEAEAAYGLAVSTLSSLELDIHPIGQRDTKGNIKTSIVEPGHPLHFLGVTLYTNTIQPQDRKIQSLFKRIDDATSADSSNEPTLLDIVTSINRIVEGWVAAFSFTNISLQQLGDIDRHVGDRVGGWMKKNGLTRDRNAVSERVARLLGLNSARTFAISPLLPGTVRLAAQSTAP